MAQAFESIGEFIAALGGRGGDGGGVFDDIIDVRSPAEFAEDHIPGAISLPVLSNEERARVGTIYVQQSPFLARKIGAALVARNAATHLEGPLAEKDGAWRPLVYCWRGGQRSNSFASILTQVGWRAGVVAGGYQAWRRLVVAALHDGALAHRLVLLDGNTGTAKTALLARLAGQGIQVLDLEGLAAHRGSVFGSRPGGQPAQKGFESALAVALEALDPARPVVVEAESARIGEVFLPPALWGGMKGAPRLTVGADLAARARYLTRAYGDVISDGAALEATLEKLVPLQGRARVDGWIAAAREGAFEALAGALMAEHYDPRYAKSRARLAEGGAAPLGHVALGDMGEAALDEAGEALAAIIREYADRPR